MDFYYKQQMIPDEVKFSDQSPFELYFLAVWLAV